MRTGVPHKDRVPLDRPPRPTPAGRRPAFSGSTVTATGRRPRYLGRPRDWAPAGPASV